jgi:hypothetical protein
VEAAGDRQPARAAHAVLLGRGLERVERRELAGDDDLARRVQVRDRADAVLGADRGQRARLGLVGAHQARHRRGDLLARVLHRLAAQAHQAQAVVERERARAPQRGVLAQRQAGDERGRREVEAALLQHGQDRDRRREDAGLRHVGAVDVVALAPAGLCEREAEHAVGVLEDGARAREGLAPVAAHADVLCALSGQQDRFAHRSPTSAPARRPTSGPRRTRSG